MPLAAAWAQPAKSVIGYLSVGVPEASAHIVGAFRKGLSEGGYAENRNLSIEFRWGHNISARLPQLAADLARLQLSAIAVPGNTSAALAAKAATTTIPIIFSGGSDPVRIGLVASLNRPGGNITGVSGMTAELGAKRLELLQQLLPAAERFAMLINPSVNSAMTGISLAD